MYGVRYVNSRNFIALYAYEQDAIIRLADGHRRGSPVRVEVVIHEPAPRKAKRARRGRGAESA